MMTLHRAALIGVIGALCSIAAAQVRDPVLYERFKIEAAKGDTAALLRTAAECARSYADPDRHLGVLALAVFQFRSGRKAEALPLLDSVWAITTDRECLIRAVGLKFMGLVHSWSGDHDLALADLDKAFSILDSAAHTEEWIDLLTVRAEVHTARNDLDAAYNTCNRALLIASQIGYSRGEALARLDIGNLKFKQSRYPEAAADYGKSLSIASAGGFDVLTGTAANNLSAAVLMAGDLDRATRMYDSLLADRSPGLLAAKPLLQEGLGYLLIQKGQYADAIPVLRAPIAYFADRNDTRGQMKPLQHLSDAMWGLGQKSEAVEHLKRALSISQEFKDARAEAEILWSLYEKYDELGQFPDALTQLRAYADVADSVNDARYDEHLVRSEVLFETERKERRITEQDQALKLADEQDRRKSLQRNIAIGSAAGLVVLALLLWRSLRTRRRLAKQEQELHAKRVDELMHEQEIGAINAMLEGQEKERDRLAKDLHDRLGSMLSAIKHQLGAVEEEVQLVRKDQSVQYGKVHRMLDDAVGEVRRISHDMITVTLSRFGLQKALEDLCDTVRVTGRLDVELRTFGLEQRMERSMEIAVYRIVQESISNVLKHAQATELSVDVTRGPGRLSVIVHDDGKGFDTSAPATGIGLENVKSRAAAIGATLRVESTIGKGTTISVEGPVIE